MVTGEGEPSTTGERLAGAILALVVLSPLVFMGCGMIFVGLLALGPRKDVPELWIGLPAGVALLGILAFALYYALIRVPRVTVIRFALDGNDLVLETPRLGCVTTPVGELRTVSEVRGRRARVGRKRKGWWLRFDRFGWVYLDRHMPNAEVLVNRLGSFVGTTHA